MSTVVTDRALSLTYGCIDHKAPLQHDGEQKNSTMFFLVKHGLQMEIQIM